MTVDTRVSLHMCALLSIDVIDGCQNNNGHPRKLSSSLFTSKGIQEEPYWLEFVKCSSRTSVECNNFLIAISSCKMGIHVKHSAKDAWESVGCEIYTAHIT